MELLVHCNVGGISAAASTKPALPAERCSDGHDPWSVCGNLLLSLKCLQSCTRKISCALPSWKMWSEMGLLSQRRRLVEPPSLWKQKVQQGKFYLNIQKIIPSESSDKWVIKARGNVTSLGWSSRGKKDPKDMTPGECKCHSTAPHRI